MAPADIARALSRYRGGRPRKVGPDTAATVVQGPVRTTHPDLPGDGQPRHALDPDIRRWARRNRVSLVATPHLRQLLEEDRMPLLGLGRVRHPGLRLPGSPDA